MLSQGGVKLSPDIRGHHVGRYPYQDTDDAAMRTHLTNLPSLFPSIGRLDGRELDYNVVS